MASSSSFGQGRFENNVQAESIKSQRIDTAAQEQGANTENALGMSSERFTQLEAIHAQREICLKGGCTLIMGGSTPLVNVGTK